MYRIIGKRLAAENVNEYVIEAPEVARSAKPGQFIILRVDECGERVPFTICDCDKELGAVTILVQTVGYTTAKLAALNTGDFIRDFVGPLGNPTDMTPYNKVLLIAGGIGNAVIYPQAKYMNGINRPADVIVGARNANLILYAEETKKVADNFYVMTDDGSAGEKGFVTTKLKELLDADVKYDCVMAVGPLMMMKAVCDVTRNAGIPTVISMNSLMVDGTGMCGCCRVTVGGVTKYACVDGPEFDGHKVDFDEAARRGSIYKEQEAEHRCRIRG